MRDYPNMSYCAFENTAAAMDQVAGMLEAALDSNEPLELNRHEQRPFGEMWEKCRALMELLERHQEMVDGRKAAEEDGPDHARLWTDTSAELA